VHEIVPVGTLDPETVITPGIHISKIVKIDHIATVGGGFKSA
jgi:3-oxoadipate CoA-transferase alpha subunit